MRMRLSAILFVAAALLTQTDSHLRGGDLDGIEFEYVDTDHEQIQRSLSSSSGDGSDDNGIYYAYAVNQYNNGQLNYLLRNHEMVAFTKKWRGTDRLILTQYCSISGSKTAGAYYCVEGSSVCVTWTSMSRFYGQHTGGGKCSILPLSDDIYNALPSDLQKAYKNTCDGDKCDGR